MRESRVTVRALVPWLCDLAIIIEQEPRRSHFPATRVQTHHRRIIWEALRGHIVACNLQVAMGVPLPPRTRIVSEQFLTLYTPVPWLLNLVVVEKLIFYFDGAAKWACLGDTHIHGGLHGRLRPAHLAILLLHEAVFASIDTDDNQLPNWRLNNAAKMFDEITRTLKQNRRVFYEGAVDIERTKRGALYRLKPGRVK